jgi:hypothetical protein
MENEFLSRYFGDNQKIINFAQLLISYGMRDAIKKLNQYVELLGDDMDAERLILKITQQFHVPQPWQNEPKPHSAQIKRWTHSQNPDEVSYARKHVLENRDLGQAVWLAEIHGLSVTKVGGIMQNKRFSIRDSISNTQVALNLSENDFVAWVSRNL